MMKKGIIFLSTGGLDACTSLSVNLHPAKIRNGRIMPNSFESKDKTKENSEAK
jgi:hypothetical protein